MIAVNRRVRCAATVHTGLVLEVLIVPACFLAAGLIGHHLGTPPRVAGGLAALGCAHLLAFLGAAQAQASAGATADWVHLASQLLFVGGFVAFVWLAAAYPDQEPSTRLVGAAAGLAVAGPLVAAVSAPTPPVLGNRELGPVVHLLPSGAAAMAAAPLLLLPLIAVVTFVLRYRRADAADRATMRWPIAGLGVIAALAVAGVLLGAGQQDVVTVLFLLAAPVFPLSLAFGPVVRHIDSLSGELAQVRERMGRHVRPEAAPGVLGRLTPRELTVLEAMAKGMSNPEVARSLHLSLSSVEKHATSIFRKLEITDAPQTHRRVTAVVTYRDALEDGAGDTP